MACFCIHVLLSIYVLVCRHALVCVRACAFMCLCIHVSSCIFMRLCACARVPCDSSTPTVAARFVCPSTSCPCGPRMCPTLASPTPWHSGYVAEAPTLCLHLHAVLSPQRCACTSAPCPLCAWTGLLPSLLWCVCPVRVVGTMACGGGATPCGCGPHQALLRR